MADLETTTILRGLADTTRRLTCAQSEHDASALLSSALADLGCPDTLVSFVRERGARRFVVGEHGTGRFERVKELTLRALDGPDILSDVVQHGQQVWIADSRADARFDRHAAHVGGIVSQVIVPLMSESRVIGTLQVSLDSPECRADTAQESPPERLSVAIAAIADVYALAVENLRLQSDLTTIRSRLPEVAGIPPVPQPAAAAGDGRFLPSRSPLNDEKLVAGLRAIPPGPAHAAEYHSYIVEVLEIIFNPYLLKPVVEQILHAGRKRIDIVFNNGCIGFFGDLVHLHRVHCPYIFVECKNYSAEICNPEIDQLAGRFSERRGRLGFLLCRRVQDRRTLLNRCRDALNDGRGYIITLDDKDIGRLLRMRGRGDERGLNNYLDDRFRELVM